MKPVSLALLLLLWPTYPYAEEVSTSLEKHHSDSTGELNTYLRSDMQPVKSISNDYTNLRYSVCNLAANPLLFRWKQPGFETGLTHPLPQNVCAVYQHGARKSRLDNATDILYTQSAVPYNAPAYLADETPGRNSLSEWITSIGEFLSTEDYKQPDAYYDLKVLSINKGDMTENTLTWSPRVDALVIKLVSSDEQALARIDQQLSYKTGIVAKRIAVSDLNELLMKDDAVPDDFSSGETIWLQAREGTERNAEILMPVGTVKERVSVPVMLLDKEGHIFRTLLLQQ